MDNLSNKNTETIDNLELFANKNKVGDPNKNESELITIKPENLKEDDFNLDKLLGNIDEPVNNTKDTNSISVNLGEELKLDDLKLDSMNEVKLEDNIFSINNQPKTDTPSNTSTNTEFLSTSTESKPHWTTRWNAIKLTMEILHQFKLGMENKYGLMNKPQC